MLILADIKKQCGLTFAQLQNSAHNMMCVLYKRSRGFAPRPTLQRLQRWRVAGNVWKIWSARDVNPIPPVPGKTS